MESEDAFVTTPRMATKEETLILEYKNIAQKAGDTEARTKVEDYLRGSTQVYMVQDNGRGR